jgi:integrase/recombinase XerD
MTLLRQRMIEDMQVRNLAPHTQATYILHVSLFARHFRKSPELLGPEEIRDYQLYLTNQRKLAPSSIVVTTAALRFLYNVTLKRGWNLEASIPAPRQPKKLPVVLSRAEVLHFLGCVEDVKHDAILTTCYAAGLGISEAVRLKASSLDNRRMVIRVAQGKGRKDRYVMLSPKLLDTLREYWRIVRPKEWLFPGISADPSRRTPSSMPAERRAFAPASPNPSALIRCAMPSRFTCSKRAPTCAPFSSSLAIVA